MESIWYGLCSMDVSGDVQAVAFEAREGEVL